MRSTNRKRALITSAAIILLCMAIIVGFTYALFTDGERVTNHLQAGSLDIALVRTKLTSTYLTKKGFLKTETNTELKDFTNDKNENVFALDKTVIVPGSEYVAEMMLVNGGIDEDGNIDKTKSDVAIGYWIEIDYDGYKTLDLANQLQITVTTDDDTTIRLKDGLVLGSASKPVGILAVGETAEFTVSLKFLDDRKVSGIENNDAQGQEAYFDIVVHAVQWVKDPATELAE